MFGAMQATFSAAEGLRERHDRSIIPVLFGPRAAKSRHRGFIPAEPGRVRKANSAAGLQQDNRDLMDCESRLQVCGHRDRGRGGIPSLDEV